MKFLKTHEHKEKHRSSISSNCELVQIHMGRSKLDQEGWIKREKSPPMEVLSIAKEFYRLSKNAPPEISQKQLDRLRTMAIYRETGEVKGLWVPSLRGPGSNLRDREELNLKI